MIVFWTKNPDPMIDPVIEIDDLGDRLLFSVYLDVTDAEGLETEYF